MSRATAANILPDLNLVGLTIDDLFDLHRFLQPLSAQFDTSTMGRPFTARYHGREDVFDDTPIGEVVSSIATWAATQNYRVIDALKVCAATNPDEADLRGSVLMADAIINGDWKKAREMFDRLAAEQQKVGGRRNG